MVVSTWRGILQNISPSPTVCGNYLGHHPSNTTILTIGYYGDTSSDDLRFRYELNLSRDFSETMGPVATMGPEKLRLVKYQCVKQNVDSNEWHRVGSRGEPNGTIISCESSGNFTNTALSYVVCSEPTKVPILIAILTEGISTFFLVLTLIFLSAARLSRDKIPQPPFLSRADIRGNKFVVEFCICLSLLALQVFVALAQPARFLSYTNSCHFIAAGMHFSVLAAAFWLLNQGISLALKVSEKYSLRFNYWRLTVFQSIAGWGIPLLIVGIIFGTLPEDYVATNNFLLQVNNKSFSGKTNPPYVRCFVNIHHHAGAKISVIATISIIVYINIFVTSWTVGVVHRMSKENAKRSHVHVRDECVRNAKCKLHMLKTAHWRTTGRAIFLLLPVSTIPWVIWLVPFIGDNSTQLAFLVSSGLQGIAIFVIICVINKDDRARIRILWKTSRIRERLQHIFSNFFCRALHRTEEENSISNAANLSKTENHLENGSNSNPFELRKSFPSQANFSKSVNSLQSSAKPCNSEKSHPSDANPPESNLFQAVKIPE